MRGSLQKELLLHFQEAMQARFPQFERVAEDRGPWKWTWQVAPNLNLFIVLQAFDKKDQFVLEVAWSEDDTFPWGGLGKIKIDMPQGRQRLGGLWRQPGQVGPVWDMAPGTMVSMEEQRLALSRGQLLPCLPDPPITDVLPRVHPLVCDAVAKLEEYGIPLFRQVLEARGFAWPVSAS